MMGASPWVKQLLPISLPKELLPPFVIASPDLSRRSDLREKGVDPILDVLPAKERIGIAVNDIPDIRGVGLARSDRTYVPLRS
jgi:hypothetical protein